MSTQESVTCITELAGADLSAAANLYKMVKKTSAAGVTLCAADTDICLGTLQSLETSGFAVAVAIDGVTKVVAGAAFAVNALLTSDGSGRAIAAVAGDRYRLQALEEATAANQVVRAALIGANTLIA